MQVAIKSISKKKVSEEQDLTRIRREIDIMATLNNKHIIQIYEGEKLRLHVINKKSHISQIHIPL